MELVFFLFFFVPIMVWVFIASKKELKKFQLAMRTVAERHGLDIQAGSTFKQPVVSGVVDGFGVTIDSYRQGSGKNSKTYTRVTVNVNLGRGFRIGREGFGSALVKAFVGSDIEIGVAGFDSSYVIKGAQEADVISRLGHQARAAVDGLFTMGAVIDDGTLVFRERGYTKDAEKLDRHLTALLDAARALTSGGKTTAARLAHHAQHDPSVGFRARCLELLLTHQPRSAPARAAARGALGDADPHLRLLAAGSLADDDAFDVTTGILSDRSLGTPVRAQAARTLASTFAGRSGVVDALRAELDAADDLFAEHLLTSLYRLSAAPAPADMAAFVASVHPQTRVAAARCLGASPTSAAEDALLQLLTDDEQAVLRAAADALGDIGTRRAVEPLLEHTSGVFRSTDLKNTARSAIKEIQARIAGAGAGQLSISDIGDEGTLALADEAGALSEVDTP